MEELIVALLENGQYVKSEKLARRFVFEQPTNSRAHSLLGTALFRQERFPEAVESFERATILDPAGWRSHLSLARALDRLQRYEEALEAAQQGARANPNQKDLALLIEGLERIAKPKRTDGWERSVHLDRHRIELTHQD